MRTLRLVTVLMGVIAMGCGHGGEKRPVAGSTDAPADGTGPPPVPTPAPIPARAAMPEVAVAGPGRLFLKGVDYEGVIVERGDWTPSPQDVADLEVALGPALAAHELGKAYPPRDFKREYGGVTIAGKQVIDIQLACQAPGWPQDPLPSLKGGGTCYGRARFDVDTRQVTLWANANR